MEDEGKKWTLEELEVKLNRKQKKFCELYVIDWNAAKAARDAGYSVHTAANIGHENLGKPYLKQYIDYIKHDYERLCNISKTKQLNELHKIAYSSIADLHDTWITLHKFESLTADQKAAIESIDSKVENKVVPKKVGDDYEFEEVEVHYRKIKLYSKTVALEMINKMLGYNEPDKVDHTSKGEGMQFQYQNVSKQFPNK